MRTLDRKIIDRIVKAETNLPRVEDMDSNIRETVWERYPPNRHPLRQHLKFHSWAIEGRWLEMNTAKKDRKSDSNFAEKVNPLAPVPFEFVIAYLYSAQSHEFVRKAVTQKVRLLSAMEEAWEGMPYPLNDPNPYSYDDREYLEHHAEQLGIVDYYKYFDLHVEYKKYFHNKYLSEMTTMGLSPSFHWFENNGWLKLNDEEKALKFFWYYSKSDRGTSSFV